MKYDPWATLTIFITPKISDRPLARRKRRAPKDKPLRDCMTQKSIPIPLRKNLEFKREMGVGDKEHDASNIFVLRRLKQFADQWFEDV